MERVMYRIFILVFFLFMFVAEQLHAAERLVLASVPWQRTEIVQDINAPMVELLSRKLQMEVTFLVTKDYKELGERIHQKVVDIGILGANSYIETKAKFPKIQYLATCKQPDDRYYSIIITRLDSNIGTLQELRGKSFGFTDKGSTSGYVYPMLMLKQAGIDIEKDFRSIYFLKKHDKVYNAIAQGAIDAGGVSTTPMEKAIKLNGDIYRELQRSAPIPRNAVIGGAHLPASLIKKIINILRDAEKDPTFRDSGSILRGFSVRSDSFYDSVRKAKGYK
jgi:phosphonate transport system substrate-binding protein